MKGVRVPFFKQDKLEGASSTVDAATLEARRRELQQARRQLRALRGGQCKHSWACAGAWQAAPNWLPAQLDACRWSAQPGQLMNSGASFICAGSGGCGGGGLPRKGA